MDPFGQQPQGPPNQFPPNQGPPLHNQGGPQQELPNATAVLVLGIVSLFFVLLGCVLGFTVFIGLITGIIGLAISGSAVRLHRENPTAYKGYGNIQAGRIMSIIALGLIALAIVIVLVYIIFLGAAFSTLPWR